MKSGSVAAALFVFLTAIAANGNAALVERLDGAAYYDEDAGLTWLTDAGASGLLDWQSALDWASSLDIGGITGWRLPTADTGCAIGASCPDSEMGHLLDTHGISFGSPGSFTGISLENYWTATLSTVDDAYQFNFLSGVQFDNPITSSALTWAVYDGDPAAVIPLPAAAWLFASGLLGLVGAARRS